MNTVSGINFNSNIGITDDLSVVQKINSKFEEHLSIVAIKESMREYYCNL